MKVGLGMWVTDTIDRQQGNSYTCNYYTCNSSLCNYYTCNYCRYATFASGKPESVCKMCLKNLSMSGANSLESKLRYLHCAYSKLLNSALDLKNKYILEGALSKRVVRRRLKGVLKTYNEVVLASHIQGHDEFLSLKKPHTP